MSVKIVPNTDIEEFERFGFKPCKGISRDKKCYYLCLSKDSTLFFVSPEIFCMEPWEDDDPRVHKRSNCKYRDKRTFIVVLFELINAGMLKIE